MGEPIIVKQSKKGNILYCVGALAMSLISLWSLFLDFKTVGGPLRFLTQTQLGCIILKILFALGFLFFAYIFFFFIRRAKNGKAILIVDETGIIDNSSAVALGFIPWTDIEKIYIDGVMGNEFIEIVLFNEEKYINKLSGFKRQAVLATRNMGHQIVCITLNSTGISPHAVLPKIQDYFQKSKAS